MDFIWYNKDINTKDSVPVDENFLQAGIWYIDDFFFLQRTWRFETLRTVGIKGSRQTQKNQMAEYH